MCVFKKNSLPFSISADGFRFSYAVDRTPFSMYMFSRLHTFSWTRFKTKKMESKFKGEIENANMPQEKDKSNKKYEPKFCDIEETYEGYGKQKPSGNKLAKKHHSVDTEDEDFFQSLTNAFGPNANELLPGDNIFDILTLNFSGMDKREVCKKLLKLAQNSLQTSNIPDSPSLSDPTRDTLLKLKKFLISYLDRDSEERVDEVFNFDVSPDSRHSSVSANDSFSSLGILDIADMSGILNDSLEGGGDQSSYQCDVTLYLNEIEELQHQNKKLTSENEMFKSQISSLEDTNQLLTQDKTNLRKEVQILNEGQKEIKDLQCQNEHLKTLISSVENSQKCSLFRVDELEKEKSLLEKNIKYLGEKLNLSQSDVEQKQLYITELAETLVRQKMTIQNICSEKEELKLQLHQKEKECTETELAVRELTEVNQCLRDDKNSIETEMEITKNKLDCALEKCSKLSDRLHSPASSPETHLESMASDAAVSFYEESMSVEMNTDVNNCTVVRLPTPLCGKQGIASRIPLLSSSYRKIYESDKSTASPHAAIKRRKNFSKQLHRQCIENVDDVTSMAPTSESKSIESNNNPIDSGGDRLKTNSNELEKASEESLSSDFDWYLQYLLQEISSLCSCLADINSQAKHALATDIDIAQLEKKLLEAKGESLALEADGDSSMPPHVFSATDHHNDKRTSDASSQVIREHISAEIKALKTQLIRSHALLSYLQEKENCSSTSFSPDVSSPTPRNPSDRRHGKITLQQQKSLDAQSTPFFNYSQKDSLSNTSHRSTPIHAFRSQSCPLLLDEFPFVCKSTQTELAHEKALSTVGVHNVRILSQQFHANRFVPVWNRSKEPRFSECSSASEVSSKSADNLECGVCEVHPIHEESVSPCLPRHRTNSFLSAVVNANNQTSFDVVNQETTGVSEAQSRLEARRKSLQSRRVVKIVPQEDEEKEKEKPVDYEEQKKDSCDTNVDRRNEKEKFFKTSQRSMRRGSGAGSPNSMTSIPRFPAFDLDEQDEDHALNATVSSPKIITETNIDLVPKVQESEPVIYQQKEPTQNTKESIQGKHEYSKAMLMPEAVENSETESAKGSFEYESLEIPAVTSEGPPVPLPDMAFPNLPNTLLMKLGINKDTSFVVESFDSQELESKFMTLSLAFKTDKMTLSKRLEIQKRQRDIAEKDVGNEIKSIKESLNYLNLNAITTETRDLIAKIQTHVDIVSLATSKVSARSETYGAVKQEERVSCAFEVMMHHVENLRRLFDKEHRELEETKRMLSGSTSPYKKLGPSEGTAVEEHRRSLKTFGLAIGTVKSVFSLKALFSSLRRLIKVVRRRASVADFQHSLRDPNARYTNFSQSWSSGFKETASRRISALLPFSSSSSVGHNSSSSSTHTCTAVVQLSSQASGSSRRCSLPAKAPLENRAISIAPTLSSVADEEPSVEEEESVQLATDVQKVETTADIVQESSVIVRHRVNPLRPPVVPYYNIREETTDSSDEGYSNSEISTSATKEKKVLLQRLGYPSAVRFWNETSSLNLLRYFASLFLAIGAFIVFVMTFLPSDNCSANDSLMHRLRNFMFRTSHSPPVV